MQQKYTNKNRGKILAAVMAFAMVFAGVVVITDSADAADVTYIKGTIIDDQTYSAGEVVVDGDLLINNGATLTINGTVKFTIKSGVTVTVDGAKTVTIPPENNSEEVTPTTGAEESAGTTTTVKASIAVSGEPTVIVDGKIIVGENGQIVDENAGTNDIKVNGSVEVLRGGSVATTSMTFANGSILEVNSAANKISTVSGNVNLMQGSTFNFKGQVGTEGGLTVTAVGETGDKKDSFNVSATITDTDGTTAVAKISNLTFTVKTTVISGYKDDVKYTISINDLYVSGSIQGKDTVTLNAVENTNTYKDKKTNGEDIEIIPTVVIADSLNVLKDGAFYVDDANVLISGSVNIASESTADNDYVKKIGFTDDGKVTITGTLNLDARNYKVPASNNGKLWVIGGTVTITGAMTDLKLSEVYGAMYTTSAATIICDLPVALEATDGVNIAEVDLYAGKESQIASEDVYEYKDAYILDKDVTIKDYVTLNVHNALIISEGATLTVSQYANITNGSWNGIISVEGKILDKSLNLAAIDTEVTANNFIDCEVVLDIDDGAAKVYTTLTLAIDGANPGDNITLAGDAEIDGKVTIPSEITLTIDGKTLTVNKNSELIVDGVLNASEGSIVTNADSGDDKEGLITINNIVITNDSIVGINTAGVSMDNATIGDLNGDMIVSIKVFANNSKSQTGTTIGKISYTGDLKFEGSLDVLSEVTINGTITLVDTTITVGVDTNNNTIIGVLSAKIASTNGAIELVKIKSITIRNDVNTEAETPVDDLVLSGTPAAETGGKLSIISGEVVADTLTASNITTFGVAANTTLSIKGASTTGALKVEGKLNVKTGSLNTGALTILGDVEIASGATLVTAGDVYVGLQSSTINADATVTGTAFTFSGVMYVASGSTVSDEIIEGKKVIDFIVDGVTFVKAYAGTDATVATITKAPIENAYFQGWLVGDSTTPVTTVSFVNGETVTATAKVKTDIYSVTIIGDNGIGTVSLDGNVLVKVNNSFIVPSNISAGQHTISFILKNGYEGTVQMTVNGEKVSGYTFTASGTNEDQTPVNILINLSGTAPAVTPTPEPSTEDDSGMGITDYLLIVLVVMVVILAIVVCVRMMRS